MLALSLILASLQVPGFDPLAYLRAHRAADAALLSGRMEEAREGFERCLALSPDNANVAYGLACAAARSGKSELALGQLECAVQWGFGDAGLAAWDLDLVSLRQEPRFAAALEGMRSRAQVLSIEPALRNIYEAEAGIHCADIAVDPQGRFVVVGRSDGTLQFLDTRSGIALRTLPSLGSEVWALDIDSRGERLAALTKDGQLHLSRIDGTGEPRCVAAIDPPDEERCEYSYGTLLQFAPGGERVLAAGTGRGASLWTCEGAMIRAWPSVDEIFLGVLLAWSPDGTSLAMPQDKTVVFIDASNGEPNGDALLTPASITSVAFQPGGRLLVTGHDDRRLRMWSLETRQLLFEHFFEDIFEADMCVNSVAFSPDGRWVAGGTGEIAYVDVLETDTGKSRAHYSMSGGHFGEPYAMSWTADSSRLWFAFACGGMPLEELILEQDRARTTRSNCHVPKLSRTGRAIAHGGWRVFSLDPHSGRLLWSRPQLTRDRELIQTSSGHFWTDQDSLEGLQICQPNVAGSERPLREFASLLFDPKRVRAARAGVELLPAKL